MEWGNSLFTDDQSSLNPGRLLCALSLVFTSATSSTPRCSVVNPAAENNGGSSGAFCADQLWRTGTQWDGVLSLAGEPAAVKRQREVSLGAFGQGACGVGVWLADMEPTHFPS